MVLRKPYDEHMLNGPTNRNFSLEQKISRAVKLSICLIENQQLAHLIRLWIFFASCSRSTHHGKLPKELGSEFLKETPKWDTCMFSIRGDLHSRMSRHRQKYRVLWSENCHGTFLHCIGMELGSNRRATALFPNPLCLSIRKGREASEISNTNSESKRRFDFFLKARFKFHVPRSVSLFPKQKRRNERLREKREEKEC